MYSFIFIFNYHWTLLTINNMCKRVIPESTRWQIVAYHKIKHSDSQIAKMCRISRKCVATTLKNYKETGSVKYRSRSGRTRISNPRDDSRLFTLTRASPTLSVRRLASMWSKDNKPIASKSSVNNRLLAFGLSSFTA